MRISHIYKKLIFLSQHHTYGELFRIILYRFKKGIQRVLMRIFWQNIFSAKGRNFAEFSPKLRFFFTFVEQEKINDFIKEYGEPQNVIFEADKVIRHIFNLLGSGDVSLGDKINWRQDFKSGFEWPRIFYRDIKIVDLDNNADVKVPWELSRFQHLAVLGQAYWLTNDEKYAKCFQDDIADWISENPVGYGVNWTCAMDVAIRAVNWIIGYHYFAAAPCISKEFWTEFHRHLYLTGKFIFRNLEADFSGHGNNHYLSDLGGLFWLALYFGDYNRETRSWLKFVRPELEKEILWQFNPEGTNFEASIPYHRLATEIALSTMILAGKNGVAFREDCRSRIEKACGFTAAYSKPNRLAPQIGDADDGRFHIFTHYGCEEKRDHRHLLAVGGVWFNRPEWMRRAGEYFIEALWFFGPECLGRRQTITTDSKKEPECLAYPEMGFYIICDERIHLTIRCGPVGQAGNGGHAHNDQLSFELNVDGKDIFVDPGTYVYTADYKARNLFRGTAMHNTVQIEGCEQNQIDELQIFQLHDQMGKTVTCFGHEDEKISFCGECRGFYHDKEIIHKRNLAYHPKFNKIVICDELSDGIEGFARFGLGENNVIKRQCNNVIRINDEVSVSFSSELINLNQTVISNSYGSKQASDRIEVRFTRALTTEIVFKDGNQ
jgi:hypothetical protein